VIIDINEYERLKHRDKKLFSIEEMPSWLTDMVISGKMDARHNHLDGVMAPERFGENDTTPI
jgi:hypothetical protein